MKKLLFVTFILITSIMNAQDTPITAFLEKWENSKDYLIKVAESMPEDAYDFKPTEREMTFEEQLLHIMQNMSWLGANYFHVKEAEVSIIKNRKERIIENVKISFNSVSSVIKQLNLSELKEQVDFFAGKKTKLQILNLLQDHVTHHRGQLIVHLNLNDVKPPKYVGW
ncbi:DinB family protein [Galbibacter sp. EGI 63066]|uniref:DinB family protein n=1 Tax=Galbibacter sp. EGI 63066 TaxID=2993559 RepID=UPI002248F2A0|nr:DinB family protein [Galbibacter sp. EGI 63066]MCX2681249.1 DinB family protein [Galbibacter sp. EGI 63066]